MLSTVIPDEWASHTAAFSFDNKANFDNDGIVFDFVTTGVFDALEVEKLCTGIDLEPPVFSSARWVRD